MENEKIAEALLKIAKDLVSSDNRTKEIMKTRNELIEEVFEYVEAVNESTSLSEIKNKIKEIGAIRLNSNEKKELGEILAFRIFKK